MKNNNESEFGTFRTDLINSINKNSLENESNTPDFIIAEYLVNCLKNYNETYKMKIEWHSVGSIKHDLNIANDKIKE